MRAEVSTTLVILVAHEYHEQTSIGTQPALVILILYQVGVDSIKAGFSSMVACVVVGIPRVLNAIARDEREVLS